MDRRDYISILAASGASLLAGCSSSGENGEGATTQPPDSTQTPTTTEQTTAASSPSFTASVSVPESIELGGDYTFTLRVENTGNVDGTWTGQVALTSTAGPEPDASSEWQTQEVELEVPAGETRTRESNSFEVSRPGAFYCRINDGEPHKTEIPASKAPILEETNLITEWNSFGDAVENRITEADAGSRITIASRYWYYAENQTHNTFSQVEVFNGSNERVGIQTTNSEQVTEQSRWVQWESSLILNTTGWGEGTYTAEMLVRDNQTDEVSDAGTVEFELV